jgi:nucleoside-diphosphate-sugar epimerase
VSKTLLLTGATGFLGSRMVQRLVERNADVVALVRTSSNTARLANVLDRIRLHDVDRTPVRQLFEETPIDTIVHCATDYGRQTPPSPSGMLAANVMLPLTLLEHGTAHGVRRFINTDTTLERRVSAYARSKKQFVEWLEGFSTQICCVNVELEHFYGPLDDPSKFIARLISDFLRGAVEIELTAGEQLRDFIYVDDVVDAYERVLTFAEDAGPGMHRFEVGSGATIRIRDLVTLIQRLTQNTTTKLKFGAVPYRANEVMESKVDNARIRALGWNPATALNDGIARTIQSEMERIASCVI